MGRPEQFAQRTFAEETERVTKGAAGWQDPPEIRLEKVQSDGFQRHGQLRAAVLVFAVVADHHVLDLGDELLGKRFA